MKLRSAGRKVTDVIRRNHYVMMISAEKQCAEHRKNKYPQPDRNVARPHKPSGHEWGDQDHDEDKYGFLGRELDSELCMGVAVPERSNEVNDDEGRNRNLGHEEYKSGCVLLDAAH